jgi:hypothetical protein
VTVCALPESRTLESAPPLRARIGLWVLVGVCLLSALLGRLSYLVRPLDADGAMFVYMGKLVSNGGRIGYELIDNKFPTVGLIVSPCWRGFGAWWPGYVFLQTSLALIGCVLLARTARRNIGSHAALPTLLFALVYVNCNFAVRGGFQLETLQSFFAILSACAGIEAVAGDDARDSFAAGLTAGMAAMVKPTGLAVLGAFGVAMLWRYRGDWRRLLAHAAASAFGLAIPISGCLAYFQAANLFAALPGIYRQIAGYAANSPWEWWDLSKPVIIVMIVGFPMLVRGYIFRRPRHRVVDRTPRAILIFAAMWMLVECAGVVAQRRMYAYHFLVLAAPASLLFGLIPRRPALAPLAAALLLPAAFSIFGAVQVLGDAPNSMQREPSEDYLAAHANPGDRVWLDGMMRLLVVTDLQPGSRYPMTFLWVNDDTAPLRYVHDMLGDFDQTHPKYIVVATNFAEYGRKLAARIKELGIRPQRRANFIAAWMQLGDYVQKHYHPEAKLQWETIYRRNDR